MYAKNLTKSARERLRKQREETQLIMARAKERRFIYVVNPPVIPHVAFGSGLQRDVLPQSGPSMTPYMRKVQKEVRSFPGPSDFDTAKRLIKNYPSKKGFSSFVSKLPRLKPTATSGFPPIGAYDTETKKSFRQDPKPFGIGAKRSQKIGFLTPGPSTYAHQVHRPASKISTAFSSKRKIWPTVTIFCSIFNTAKCYKCGSTPCGDYWRNFTTALNMCRPCMKKELAAVKGCSTDVFHRIRVLRELNDFQPARYCGFFHDHKGTTAAIQAISKKTLHFKIKKENYLYSYL